ncbi:hypothetical protein [Laspinema palackyanum]|uniref:hypothetical protein n=1 Tax=Laspinema palackyanum TaxID=3231601 RepID=UPI00345D7A1E|nr:hypothetical protein [Laspinema sp. D2c]
MKEATQADGKTKTSFIGGIGDPGYQSTIKSGCTQVCGKPAIARVLRNQTFSC